MMWNYDIETEFSYSSILENGHRQWNRSCQTNVNSVITYNTVKDITNKLIELMQKLKVPSNLVKLGEFAKF